MGSPALNIPHGISYDEFLASVDEGVHAEWVDGEVVLMSPASEQHAAITTFLAAVIRGYVKRKGLGGRVYHAPFQVRLGPRSGREPDVLYVAEENLHRFRRTFVDGPADLAVEVVSPESRERDCVVKFREYQQAGVREYWLVDPAERTAQVFRLVAGHAYELVPPGTPPRLRSDVVPGLWIDVEWLWSEDPDEWVAYKAWGLI